MKPSPTARAEAAAWVARLHGPNRTPEVEAGFRRWMSEDPERAAAFELLTDTWEKSARLRRRPVEQVKSWELPGFRISFSRAAFATAAVAILAIIGTVLFLRDGVVATGVGEQRTLALKDGTRVYLNTDSQVVVQYDSNARRIELKRGEALFEVAKRPDWPFIVTAGERQVRALGTAFIVRRDDNNNLAVTLVEGKVTVSPVREPHPQPKSDMREHSPLPLSQSEFITLSPGQRLTFATQQPPKLDRPPIDKVTAWQRGKVALDNTPLADAVAEMNRYSNVRLVIEDPQAAAIPVSGIFRAGDQEDFAQAVAKTYGLQLRAESSAIVLAGSGSPPAATGKGPQP